MKIYVKIHIFVEINEQTLMKKIVTTYLTKTNCFRWTFLVYFFSSFLNILKFLKSREVCAQRGLMIVN